MQRDAYIEIGLRLRAENDDGRGRMRTLPPLTAVDGRSGAG